MIVLILAVYSAFVTLVVMAGLMLSASIYRRWRKLNQDSSVKVFPRAWLVGLTFLSSVGYVVLISINAGDAVPHMGLDISVITGVIGGAVAIGPVLWLSRVRFMIWGNNDVG